MKNEQENSGNELNFHEQNICFNFYAPLKELIKYKQIKTDIMQQKEIIEKKWEELKDCKFEKIDNLQIKPKKEDLDNRIDELKTQKQ